MGLAHAIEHAIHAGSAFGARADVFHLRTQQIDEQRITGRPRLLFPIDNQHARHAKLGSDGGGHADVIRLQAAHGDERVGAFGERPRHQHLQLADLVPARAERQGIVAFDEEPRGHAEQRAQAREFFHRRRVRRQRQMRSGHTRSRAARRSLGDGEEKGEF